MKARFTEKSVRWENHEMLYLDNNGSKKHLAMELITGDVELVMEFYATK